MAYLDSDAERCLAFNWPRLAALVTRIAVLVGVADRLPGTLRNQALRLIRPAESMARRLLILMAVRENGDLSPARGGIARTGPASRRMARTASAPRKEGHNLPLLDPIRIPTWTSNPPYAKLGPRIWRLGMEWTYLPQESEAETDYPAQPVRRRLARLQAVLDDREKHVARMRRWLARRRAADRPGRITPLRIGRPPGYCRRGPDALVHSALLDLSFFASDAIKGLVYPAPS